jgi:hypothetical protein
MNDMSWIRMERSRKLTIRFGRKFNEKTNYSSVLFDRSCI